MLARQAGEKSMRRLLRLVAVVGAGFQCEGKRAGRGPEEGVGARAEHDSVTDADVVYEKLCLSAAADGNGHHCGVGARGRFRAG